MMNVGYIPKKIHQIWLDKTRDDGALPEKFSHRTMLTKTRNPGWDYRLWKMRDANELFNLPELKRWSNFFKHTLSYHIERCDFLRYALLYIHGGVYVDVDMEPLLSFDEMNLSVRHFLWVEDHAYWAHNAKFYGEKPVYNGILASAARHPIWPQLMDYIMYTYEPDGLIMCSTGPIALGRFARITNLFEDRSLWGERCMFLPKDAYGNEDIACRSGLRGFNSNESLLSSSWLLSMGAVPWLKAKVKDHHLLIILVLSAVIARLYRLH
jgi:hypothetical protein